MMPPVWLKVLLRVGVEFGMVFLRACRNEAYTGLPMVDLFLLVLSLFTWNQTVLYLYIWRRILE